MSLVKDTSKLKNFLVLWFGQTISSLGSSMTSFAITIWAYERTGSALTLSVSGILTMLPRMVGGVMVGPLVDRMNKKTVMLLADLGAGLCSLALFLLLLTDSLEIWHIYFLNFFSGILSSFQSPASDVAVSLTVPKEYYIKAGGLQSFSSGTIQIISPVLAAAVLGFTGMSGVIVFDFFSLIFACFTLVAFVKLPTETIAGKYRFDLKSYFDDLKKGFDAINDSKLLKTLMIYFAFINLVAGITYFNLISPMILTRSGSNTQALALVNGAIGFGGITGGVLVTLTPPAKSKMKSIFLCAGLSFAFGDILLALGNSTAVWVIGGFLSSVFIPALNANEGYFWRTLIPVEIQGRAFSFKYSLQSGMIPLGMFLGGIGADCVFEPFMEQNRLLLSGIIGSGKGAGMALMFLITGILGALISTAGFFNASLQKAEKEPERI